MEQRFDSLPLLPRILNDILAEQTMTIEEGANPKLRAELATTTIAKVMDFWMGIRKRVHDKALAEDAQLIASGHFDNDYRRRNGIYLDGDDEVFAATGRNYFDPNEFDWRIERASAGEEDVIVGTGGGYFSSSDQAEITHFTQVTEVLLRTGDYPLTTLYRLEVSKNFGATRGHLIRVITTASPHPLGFMRDFRRQSLESFQRLVAAAESFQQVIF